MLVQKMACKKTPTPVKEGMPAALKNTSAVATQSPDGLVLKRRKKLSVEEQRAQQEAEAKAAESDVDDTKVVAGSSSDSDDHARQQKSKTSAPDMRRVSQGHAKNTSSDSDGSATTQRTSALKPSKKKEESGSRKIPSGPGGGSTRHTRSQPTKANVETTQDAENTDGPQKSLHAGRGSQGFSRVRSHTRAGRGVRVLHGVPQSGSARMYTPGSFRAPNVLSRQRQH